MDALGEFLRSPMTQRGRLKKTVALRPRVEELIAAFREVNIEFVVTADFCQAYELKFKESIHPNAMALVLGFYGLNLPQLRIQNRSRVIWDLRRSAT